MEKRYQVFVSSTYADLKDERQHVIQTLMEMDCIPAGMELFPASDEDQFNFIKRVIDDCDYYILIVGGRYGSLTSAGISYTEQEFDYATSKGLRIIALLHGQPESLSVSKTDNDPLLAKQLQVFREKAQTGRLVKYWQRAEELPGMVSLSLSKTIKTYPAVGWVRATAAGSAELLAEINELRKENEALRNKSNVFEQSTDKSMPDLAGLDEMVDFSGKYNESYARQSYWYSWDHRMSWGDAFALIAPKLMKQESEQMVEIQLRKAILHAAGQNFYESKLSPGLFDTVKIQFKALGLVSITEHPVVKGGTGLFWTLTSKGEAEMVRRRAVRTSNS